MLKKTKYRLRMLKAISPFASGVKKFYLLNIVLMLITMSLGFVQPMFYKLFIDDVIINKQIDKMIYVIIGYVAIFIVNLSLGYVKLYSNNRLLNRTTFRVKFRLWHELFKKDFHSYDSLSVGEAKMRFHDDANCIGDFADAQTISYLQNFVTMIVSAVIMFVIRWQIAIFIVVVIPLTFYLDHIISKQEKKAVERNRIAHQKQYQWAHTTMQGWREVKALNLQKREQANLVTHAETIGKNNAKWLIFWTTRELTLPKIKNELLLRFLLYFIGGILIIQGFLTIGELLMFALYHDMLSNSLKAVSSADANLQSNRPTSDRLLEELEHIKSKKDDYKNKIIPKAFSGIEFDNVHFAYPKTEKEVLNSLSFRIDKGERVAIVGKSGAGKTTILKLMMGMLEPTDGRILFSDIDLKNIDMSQMFKSIGFVMQDNMLFNTTVRENLQYAKPNATDAEFDEACKKAYIHDFIMSLPNGYDTIIGERGIKLSGGQRQRIVLARLFLRNVDVFIFDEATSALDQYSENIVHDAINNIAKDKTIIVVAHRQSSIELCDRKIEL